MFGGAGLPRRPRGGGGARRSGLTERGALAAVARLCAKGARAVPVFKRARKTAEIDAKDLKDYEGRRAQRGRVCDVGFRPDRLE